MATARFRFFTGGDGRMHVWPPFEFVPKPHWGGSSQIQFDNATDDRVDFEDADAALAGSAPGQNYQVAGKTTRSFDVAENVALGQSYRFIVRYPPSTGQETQKLAFVADNPEIIITG